MSYNIGYEFISISFSDVTVINNVGKGTSIEFTAFVKIIILVNTVFPFFVFVSLFFSPNMGKDKVLKIVLIVAKFIPLKRDPGNRQGVVDHSL